MGAGSSLWGSMDLEVLVVAGWCEGDPEVGE